jgi:hypothetical protein
LLNDLPVQVDSRLASRFQGQVDPNPRFLPELSDSEARSLATKVVEPIFPPGRVAPGTEIVVQISANETGRLTGVGSPQHLPNPVFFAAHQALAKRQFTAYIKEGKPQYFDADITFHIR